jgi:hypothetical protein
MASEDPPTWYCIEIDTNREDVPYEMEYALYSMNCTHQPVGDQMLCHECYCHIGNLRKRLDREANLRNKSDDELTHIPNSWLLQSPDMMSKSWCIAKATQCIKTQSQMDRTKSWRLVENNVGASNIQRQEMPHGALQQDYTRSCRHLPQQETCFRRSLVPIYIWWILLPCSYSAREWQAVM